MKRILVVVLAIFLSTACNSTTPTPSALPGGPLAWIDEPLDGSQSPPAPLEIVSHTTDWAPIAQVELTVNGAVVRSDPNSSLAEMLVTMRQKWTPPGPGNYTIQVRAQSTAGIWGNYARAVVTIAGGGIVQGTVYSDLNANGLPNDPGDAPMDGVIVTLSGCASRTTATANGTFQFKDLPAGACLVQIAKNGWKFSGTYPVGIGYPAKAASDLTKPTAFSLFMTPLVTPPPTTPPPTPRPLGPSPLPPVSIAFFADQLNTIPGQCTTIHWQVTNASQVFVDNASIAASGSKQDCPSRTVTHSLRVVTLDNQTVQRSLTITVVPPNITRTLTPTPTRTPVPLLPAPVFRGCSGAPNISSFGASPAQVYVGQKATLSWGAVTNSDSVEIDHDVGGVATPGSTTVSPAATTTFTLTAHCGANTATRQTTVTVLTRGLLPSMR